MAAWIYLSAIIAPALVWIFYFYYKDRFQPEPWRNLGLTYLLGLISAFACIHFFKLLPYLGIPDDPSAMERSRLSLDSFISSKDILSYFSSGL